MTDTEKWQGAFASLAKRSRHEREAGAAEFERLLGTGDSEQCVQRLDERLAAMLEADQPWPAQHGALIAYIKFLAWLGRNQATAASVDPLQLLERAMRLLLAEEPRVRVAAGDLIARICATQGPVFYAEHVEQPLLSRIEENLYLDRDPTAEETPEGRRLKEKLLPQCEHEHERTPTSSGGSVSSFQSSIYHDTAGWRTLVSDVQCLAKIAEELGNEFVPCISEHFLEVVLTCCVHPNRFVRQKGFSFYTALFAASPGFVAQRLPQVVEPLSERLASGLCDSWSDVRMAASLATRSFFQALTNEQKEKCMPVLLPRMCFNRHHFAEGLRNYSQETWRQVMGTTGPAAIQRLIVEVISYYSGQARCESFEMRDAACACIGELASKIDGDTVRPHATVLQDLLLERLNDEHWLVRTSACGAQTKLLAAFPDVCRASAARIRELLFENLSERSAALREEAAAALAALVMCYPDDGSVLRLLQDQLLSAQSQPTDVSEGHGPSNGKRKMETDGEDSAHTDQPMFCCCSIATPVTRANAGPKHPWEASDGCVFLLRELSAGRPDDVAGMLPKLAALANLRHFVDHPYLLTTIWKALPVIAEHIGKRRLKRHLDVFLESLGYTVGCGNRLAETAAQQCTRSLAELIGPEMLRARINQIDPTLLRDLAVHMEAS
eukprot:TRINITY_DN83670_c0_g1_i1.p1 TRINITY_DN83670_c0_g1~~TRINITY_DN83670_c0_g1_i1.p1  ORF type:complete len:675 (+),score=108.03 TRINITY_DN83670_c0_g1_i1:25-2025(+)